jgi:hypothetical protein
MVVVVTDPILVTGRRPGGLDASDEALVGQDPEGVEHRLARNGTDVGPYDLGDVDRRAVRSTGHRPQDCQTLGRDLDTVLAKKVSWSDGRLQGHGHIIYQTSDSVQDLS